MTLRREVAAMSEIPSNHPVVRLTGARKVYSSGAVVALDGVDLSVQRGEHVAIMGSSGSGKSTLLNVLGTLDRLDAGRYEIDGVGASELDDDAASALRNRKIGFV